MASRDELIAAISVLVRDARIGGSGDWLLEGDVPVPPFTPEQADAASVWLIGFAESYRRRAKDGQWPGIVVSDGDDDSTDDDC